MKALPGLDTPSRIMAAAGLGAVIEAAMVWRFGWSDSFPAYLVFGVAAAVVSVTDVTIRRVPNRVVVSTALGGLVLLAAASAGSGAWWPLARAGIGAALLAGFYLALGLAFPAGMGLSDVKWAGVVGVYLGYLGWTTLPTATLLAFGAAATVVLASIVVRRGRRLVLPMAPFMAAGALLVVLATR
ncbi:MAG: A24 family peptidase [Actinomycetota bacterium]|nr:A24 family peptidase [Actinomycetota bacterium]